MEQFCWGYAHEKNVAEQFVAGFMQPVPLPGFRLLEPCGLGEAEAETLLTRHLDLTVAWKMETGYKVGANQVEYKILRPGFLKIPDALDNWCRMYCYQLVPWLTMHNHAELVALQIRL